MRGKYLYWALALALAATLVAFGCKGKAAKETGKFEDITVEETTTPTEEGVEEVSLPEQPVYHPTKLDNLVILDDTLGSAEDTLGWDNIFCSIALDKCVGLFEELAPAYSPGKADRDFIDAAIADLGNIDTWLNEKIDAGEGVDPKGADAKAKKKKIADIRARVQAMIAGPAPKKEPIPEWKGDLMKKKWHERGEMLKRKWAERGKK
jgi:hypothetical protein